MSRSDESFAHESRSATCCFFFFQAEDGIRDLVRSRGLGDVYKRQPPEGMSVRQITGLLPGEVALNERLTDFLLWVSDYLSLIHI